MYQTAKAIGAADLIYGVAGQQICNMTTSIPSALTFPGADFALAFLAPSGGGNDVAAGTTPAALAACWDALLTNMDALSNPPTHIVVTGLPSQASPYPTTYDTAIAAVVANHSRACFTSMVSPGAWLNTVTNASAPTTGDRQSDDIHVVGSAAGSLFGYAKWASAHNIPLAAGYLQGASYALTGPTSGNVGTPYTFTVGAVTGAYFGGETITPSDFGGGGTFTPSSVTLTAFATSATFTYAASGAGAKTIGLGSLPSCYTAPTALSFSASAPVNNSHGFLLGKLQGGIQ